MNRVSADGVIDWGAVARALSLGDYNTRVVVIGTTLLGIASGAIGVFLLLRRRSLISDAISHATLPGIATAYIVMQALFGAGKFFPGLIAGAVVSGLAGMGAILLIRNLTRLYDDVAIGIVLSVSFGFGVALLGVIQKMSSGHAAGLERFIYGKTASMIAGDAILIAGASLVILFCVVLFLKEFAFVSFDQDYALSQGYSVTLLDALMIGLAVMITVIGLQSVGLILMVAMLILPAAAARFWTHHIWRMLILSGLFGGLSGFCGSIISASAPQLPAGAVIVVSAGVLFLVGMICGSDRGIAIDALRSLRYRVDLQLYRLLIILQYRLDLRLIRALCDDTAIAQHLPIIDRAWVQHHTQWNGLRALAVVSIARMRRMLRRVDADTYRLTPRGLRHMLLASRSHELQHLYVRSHPEQAQNMLRHEQHYIEQHLPRRVIEPLKQALRRTKPHLFNDHTERLLYGGPA